MGKRIFGKILGRFLFLMLFCLLLFITLLEDEITKEDLGDMACHNIAGCCNNKLGINHRNRVVQDVSKRIKE